MFHHIRDTRLHDRGIDSIGSGPDCSAVHPCRGGIAASHPRLIRCDIFDQPAALNSRTTYSWSASLSELTSVPKLKVGSVPLTKGPPVTAAVGMANVGVMVPSVDFVSGHRQSAARECGRSNSAAIGHESDQGRAIVQHSQTGRHLIDQLECGSRALCEPRKSGGSGQYSPMARAEPLVDFGRRLQRFDRRRVVNVEARTEPLLA